MRHAVRFPGLFCACALLLSAGLSALALWAYDAAQTPFGYMVVGTLGTAVGLTVVFVALIGRKGH